MIELNFTDKHCIRTGWHSLLKRIRIAVCAENCNAVVVVQVSCSNPFSSQRIWLIEDFSSAVSRMHTIRALSLALLAAATLPQGCDEDAGARHPRHALHSRYRLSTSLFNGPLMQFLLKLIIKRVETVSWNCIPCVLRGSHRAGDLLPGFSR